LKVECTGTKNANASAAYIYFDAFKYAASDGTSSQTTYLVSYHTNGATSGTAPASQTKTQDVAVVVSGNSGNLARTGYAFAGWNTAADGFGTDYAVGTNYTANASITLYAKWSPNAQAPAITADPASVTVIEGATATFNVTATGTAPLSYQWYKNSATIGGATVSSYTTPATTLADNNAGFKVTVSNAYGVATSTVAVLTVNAAPTGGVVATGGTITNYTLNGTNYTAHVFASNGTFAVSGAGSVEVLAVAGGGGGGGHIGGGGGGGGVLVLTSVSVTSGSNYTISVGGGGKGGAGGAVGGTGTNTTCFGATAAGGGGGGYWQDTGGANGGSGGGAGASQSGTPSGGTSTGSSLGGNTGTIYGNNGGTITGARAGGDTSGRGGGGAGAAASNGPAADSPAGPGGAGMQNSFMGTNYYWGGGGGGGAYDLVGGGAGGLGGGGGGGSASSI
jgi:uncharacterized repeat protein (TIGR02543 family)